jgi:hypothetical protein
MPSFGLAVVTTVNGEALTRLVASIDIAFLHGFFPYELIGLDTVGRLSRWERKSCGPSGLWIEVT